MNKVYLVEDHPIVRRGLAEILIQKGYEICGEAGNCNDALAGIVKSSPSIIILDLSLGDDDGNNLISELRKRKCKVPVLVFSMYSDALRVQRALKAGAKGYVTKHEVMDVLIEAIQQILSGKTYLSQRIGEVIAEQMASGLKDSDSDPVSGFSERENEVYHLMGQGYSFSEIAEKINLSPKTIESYFSRIKMKLNIESNRDLLRHAIQYLTSKN